MVFSSRIGILYATAHYTINPYVALFGIVCKNYYFINVLLCDFHSFVFYSLCFIFCYYSISKMFCQVFLVIFLIFIKFLQNWYPKNAYISWVICKKWLYLVRFYSFTVFLQLFYRILSGYRTCFTTIFGGFLMIYRTNFYKIYVKFQKVFKILLYICIVYIYIVYIIYII